MHAQLACGICHFSVLATGSLTRWAPSQIVLEQWGPYKCPKNKWVTGVELYPSSNNHGKMGPPNSSYLLNTAIFHFHDCGRKSKPTYTWFMGPPCMKKVMFFFKIHCGESINGAKPLPSSMAFFVFGPFFAPKRGAVASDRPRSLIDDLRYPYFWLVGGFNPFEKY